MRKLFSAALLIVAAFAMTGSALADIHATTKVENKTNANVWVTLYYNAGPFGWAIDKDCKPGYASPGWSCTTHKKNGALRLRAEIQDNSRRYDFITTYWNDGAQHKYTPGPDSWFFICKDDKSVYWSYTANCSLHNNS